MCGSPDIPLHLLKSVATYKGIEPSASLIQWFWEVMESFSNTERSLFLRFVWGRTRLPRTIADFRGRDFVIQVRFLHILWCQLWGYAPCTRSYSRLEMGLSYGFSFFLGTIMKSTPNFFDLITQNFMTTGFRSHFLLLENLSGHHKKILLLC